MKRISIFILIILGLSVFYKAGAQTESQIVPGEKKQLTIVTEPVCLYKGFFRIGLLGSYSVNDRYFNSEGQKVWFSQSSWARVIGFDLIGQYGITDRLQMDIILPYKNNARFYNNFISAPGNDVDFSRSWDLRGSGLGDISSSLRCLLIPEKNVFPSISCEAGVVIPTGRKNPTDIVDSYDFTLPTGYGEFSITTRLLARKIVYPFSFKLYGDYNIYLGGEKLFYATDTEETSFKSGNRSAFGLSVDLLLNEWIALANEFNYFSFAKSTYNGIRDENSMSGGLSYQGRIVFQLHNFRIGEAVIVPLSGKTTGADPFYIFLLQYVF